MLFERLLSRTAGIQGHPSCTYPLKTGVGGGGKNLFVFAIAGLGGLMMMVPGKKVLS